jgi:hypothetical protein
MWGIELTNEKVSDRLSGFCSCTFIARSMGSRYYESGRWTFRFPYDFAWFDDSAAESPLQKLT